MMEKCMKDGNVFVCLTDGFDGVMVAVQEYEDGMDDMDKWIVDMSNVGYIETDKWIVEGEGCNDNFVDLLLMGFNEICVNNGRDEISINGGNNDNDMVFGLGELEKWEEVYIVNGNEKRFCEYMFGKYKLCVGVDVDDSHGKINEIYLEKMNED